MWNTRLPHRPTIVKKVESLEPRINIVLGVSPWLDYDKENDSFSKNEYFGKPINEIVKEKSVEELNAQLVSLVGENCAEMLISAFKSRRSISGPELA